MSCPFTLCLAWSSSFDRYERDDVQAMVLVNGPDVAWDGMQSPSIEKLIEHKQQAAAGGAAASGGRPKKRKMPSSGGRTARSRFDDSDSD